MRYAFIIECGLKAAPFVGALLLASCGGSGTESASEGETQNTFALSVVATESIAGVQWAVPQATIPTDGAVLQASAVEALGPTARVISRSAVLADGRVVTQWLVYAPRSSGSSDWVLVQQNAKRAMDLPVPEAVLCADAQGNPVICTLAWRQL